MSDDIVWEEPPASARKPGVWWVRMIAVMQQPGRWARIWTGTNQGAASGVVNQLKKRGYRYPAGEFELCARKLGENHYGVYARYLGPADEKPIRAVR